ncbi:DUF4054 domain-containing protein [Helicobacter sp. MIT 05-5294]|uniref:DUF4054 domain-containing protein n=1 Tax=Helicobacter sp. MIT 05-5294 TaxID=1548150 RepID=UPI00051FA6AE|nr:DUF4054 domain-containing protein [Helicobacter sp. MIT 05-5294]TLD85795.1 DUF4054 domain-containing protein [Helicobacter sp. MIT 05-5294]
MLNNPIQDPLFSLQPKSINAKVGIPAYFDVWLVKDCEISIKHNCGCVNIIENFNAGNRINFAINASKGGTYKFQIIGNLKQQEPEPEAPLETFNVTIATLDALDSLPNMIKAGGYSTFVFDIANDLGIERVLLNALDDSEIKSFTKTENADNSIWELNDLETLFLNNEDLAGCKIDFYTIDSEIKSIVLSKDKEDANAGIMLTELIVNGTEKNPNDTDDKDNTQEPPNVNDSAVSIPMTPLIPATRVKQVETLVVVVEMEIPKELEALCKMFPELAPTMQTQDEINNWEAVLKKVKCIYQEFAQPKSDCEAYPLLVLTAHYGVINGLGNSVGITRSDGVVASSSVGDVSVSFQTQPYGSNEFTYFLGLTKYGLEFLAWLNRRSGLYYAN